MRKIKETYYCDRCGKEINRQKYIYEIFGPRVIVQVNRADDWMPADLCDDCQKAFKAWWKEGNKT